MSTATEGGSGSAGTRRQEVNEFHMSYNIVRLLLGSSRITGILYYGARDHGKVDHETIKGLSENIQHD